MKLTIINDLFVIYVIFEYVFLRLMGYLKMVEYVQLVEGEVVEVVVVEYELVEVVGVVE